MGQHDGHRNRLRRRFLDQGLDALTDREVLELLLFYALPRKDTSELAGTLLTHFGSIAAVLEAPLPELRKVGGIGENSAILLHLVTPMARRYLLSRSEKGVVLSNTQECGEYLIPFFFGKTEEMIYLLCLDAKCKVLCCRLLQEGSGSSVPLSIRKAAEVAITCNASSVIISHNHTSGVALPSNADFETTRMLRDALEPLDIVLADHIIVAGDDFTSMRESGFFI